ncbi:MAG: hypothetical protein RR337_13280 [Clostridia bacterium]
MNDRQAVLTLGKPPRKYIVRRLLPIECCRLQGYPDGWPDLICVAWTKASVTPENADPAVQFADDVEFSVLYPELPFKTKMADIPLAVQEMSFGNQIDDITPWIA